MQNGQILSEIQSVTIICIKLVTTVTTQSFRTILDNRLNTNWMRSMFLICGKLSVAKYKIKDNTVASIWKWKHATRSLHWKRGAVLSLVVFQPHSFKSCLCFLYFVCFLWLRIIFKKTIKSKHSKEMGICVCDVHINVKDKKRQTSLLAAISSLRKRSEILRRMSEDVH